MRYTDKASEHAAFERARVRQTLANPRRKNRLFLQGLARVARVARVFPAYADVCARTPVRPYITLATLAEIRQDIEYKKKMHDQTLAHNPRKLSQTLAWLFFLTMVLYVTV